MTRRIDNPSRRSVASALTGSAASLAALTAFPLTQTFCAAAADAGQDKSPCTDDVILVFDASGSMATSGYNGFAMSRIEEARIAVREVLPQVTAIRRIGLIVYGPGPKNACQNIEPLVAPDYYTADAIIAVLERIEPDGDTPLTAAVEAAAEILNFRETRATIVLVTDGDETCGGDPCAVARRLAREGHDLKVHVIGFKIRGPGASVEWESRAETSPEISAQCLPQETGGLYVTAETAEDLVKALRQTLECPVLTEAPFDAPTNLAASFHAKTARRFTSHPATRRRTSAWRWAG